MEEIIKNHLIYLNEKVKEIVENLEYRKKLSPNIIISEAKCLEKLLIEISILELMLNQK
jgi:hypothetical protein